MRRVLPVLGVIVCAALLANCGGGNSATDEGGAPGSIYASTVYADSDIVKHADLVFSHRPNEGRVQYTSEARHDIEVGTDTLTLLLDVWVPPNAQAGALAPLVVWVHGGGFVSGGKEERADDALSYAKAGYVAASINYRLTPDNTVDGATRLRAIEQASDDLMNAVRYLKAHAAEFHIDPNRVAVIGTSAGGGLALVNAVQYDDMENTLSDYPGISARADAAISTGATLIDPLFDSDTVLEYDAADTPVLLFHANPHDSSTDATWDGNVIPTQTRINDSGNSCTAVPTANNAHTVPLALGSKWWPTVQPFLWEHLRLSSL